MTGDNYDVAPDEVDRLHETLRSGAESGGYHLNPDMAMTRGLLRGLLVNGKRYGYPSCPCRLASGSKEADLDIICPCDYRDPDLADYGACYCALYVSQDVVEGKIKPGPVPERRPPPEKRLKDKAGNKAVSLAALPLPVWRCRVCGYLCARDGPPEVCPICKAKKDRFALFI